MTRYDGASYGLPMTDRNTHDAQLTLDEVAKMHRVSRRTVERWIKSGNLPASKLPGGLVRIQQSDADALLTPSITSPAVPSSPEVDGAAGESSAFEGDAA